MVILEYETTTMGLIWTLASGSCTKEVHTIDENEKWQSEEQGDVLYYIAAQIHICCQ